MSVAAANADTARLYYAACSIPTPFQGVSSRVGQEKALDRREAAATGIFFVES